MTRDRPPTVADLRVKLCYICREEETVDAPSRPPRRFVHPCSCTLIAHETCLLEWIRSSEGTTREASARQCPQCKTPYEVESRNPLVLRFLRAVDKNLGGVDLGFYIVGIGFIIRAVYRAQLNYGAWALRTYIGEETFDLLLSNDSSAWPLFARLNIVCIPASLILARLGSMQALAAILASWPAIISFVAPSTATAPSTIALPPADSPEFLPAAARALWPPSPLLFGALLPFATAFYKHHFARFSRWVLGIPNPGPRLRNNEPGVRPTLLQRLLDNMERAADGGREANANANANANNANNNANGNNAADENISVDMRRVGRLIGGALLAPAIASNMGRLLFRLSPHFSFLRAFLAIRPAWQGFLPPPPLKPYSARELWRKTAGELGGESAFDVGKAAKLVLRAVWGDVRKLDDCDPVWWRNSIGFGLFVVAKDCIQLFHLWLTQRELATRRVKNRDFSGVDPHELDLLPTAVATAA